MKFSAKLLAILMVALCAVACGGASKETETEAKNAETQGEAQETETEIEEDSRLSVKDDIPADLNFANASDNTVTFFVRDNTEMFKYEMDVDEITDNTLWDAIYRRNDTVETRLGVEITTISQSGAWGAHIDWFQTLRNAVNTKSGDYDTAAVYLSQGSALAVEGMYYNLLGFPNISHDKPWWNKNIQEETTMFDALYYLAGDIAISEMANGICLFFNKTLYEEKFASWNMDLYDTVESGEWTIDLLYDLLSNAWEDTNGTGMPDDGDTLGIIIGANAFNTNGDPHMDAWIPALGLSVTRMEDGLPVLTIYNERSIAAYEKVQQLFGENQGAVHGDSGQFENSGFAIGKSLFMRNTLDSGSKLRDMADPYGVLPLPKFDEEQEGYHTCPHNDASLVVVLSSCLTEKTAMVGATLELMAAESYKQVAPAYYDIVLKSKYADEPRDADMYDIILGSFEYSFGYVYSTQSLSSVGNLFRNLTIDFAQTYEANAAKYQANLDTLVDKLDEIAWLGQ